jgi:hypothetical protein
LYCIQEGYSVLPGDTNYEIQKKTAFERGKGNSVLPGDTNYEIQAAVWIWPVSYYVL